MAATKLTLTLELELPAPLAGNAEADTLKAKASEAVQRNVYLRLRDRRPLTAPTVTSAHLEGTPV